MNGNQHLDWLRDAWFMAELENRLLQKQTNRSSQRSEGANMATWLTRGGSNQVRGRKKKYEHIGRFKLFLDRNQYLAQIFVSTWRRVRARYIQGRNRTRNLWRPEASWEILRLVYLLNQDKNMRQWRRWLYLGLVVGILCRCIQNCVYVVVLGETRFWLLLF